MAFDNKNNEILDDSFVRFIKDFQIQKKQLKEKTESLDKEIIKNNEMLEQELKNLNNKKVSLEEPHGFLKKLLFPSAGKNQTLMNIGKLKQEVFNIEKDIERINKRITELKENKQISENDLRKIDIYESLLEAKGGVEGLSTINRILNDDRVNEIPLDDKTQHYQLLINILIENRDVTEEDQKNFKLDQENKDKILVEVISKLIHSLLTQSPGFAYDALTRIVSSPQANELFKEDWVTLKQMVEKSGLQDTGLQNRKENLLRRLSQKIMSTSSSLPLSRRGISH